MEFAFRGFRASRAAFPIDLQGYAFARLRRFRPHFRKYIANAEATNAFGSILVVATILSL